MDFDSRDKTKGLSSEDTEQPDFFERLIMRDETANGQSAELTSEPEAVFGEPAPEEDDGMFGRHESVEDNPDEYDFDKPEFDGLGFSNRVVELTPDEIVSRPSVELNAPSANELFDEVLKRSGLSAEPESVIAEPELKIKVEVQPSEVDGLEKNPFAQTLSELLAGDTEEVGETVAVTENDALYTPSFDEPSSELSEALPLEAEVTDESILSDSGLADNEKDEWKLEPDLYSESQAFAILDEIDDTPKKKPFFSRLFSRRKLTTDGEPSEFLSEDGLPPLSLPSDELSVSLSDEAEESLPLEPTESLPLEPSEPLPDEPSESLPDEPESADENYVSDIGAVDDVLDKIYDKNPDWAIDESFDFIVNADDELRPDFAFEIDDDETLDEEESPIAASEPVSVEDKPVTETPVASADTADEPVDGRTADVEKLFSLFDADKAEPVTEKAPASEASNSFFDDSAFGKNASAEEPVTEKKSEAFASFRGNIVSEVHNTVINETVAESSVVDKTDFCPESDESDETQEKASDIDDSISFLNGIDKKADVPVSPAPVSAAKAASAVEKSVFSAPTGKTEKLNELFSHFEDVERRATEEHVEPAHASAHTQPPVHVNVTPAAPVTPIAPVAPSAGGTRAFAQRGRTERINELFSHFEGVEKNAFLEAKSREMDKEFSVPADDVIYGMLRDIKPTQDTESPYDKEAFERAQEAARKRMPAYDDNPVPTELTEPVERAGVVMKKGNTRFFRTEDLQPIPTLISATMALEDEKKKYDETIHTSAEGSAFRKVPQIDAVEGQMSFFGFSSAREDDAETVDEETFENDVLARRQEKIRNFRMTRIIEGIDSERHAFNDSLHDDSELEETANNEKYLGSIPEYILETDRRKVGWSLLNEHRKGIWSIVFLVLIDIGFILLELIPRATETAVQGAASGSFIRSILSVVLLMVAVVISLGDIIPGFEALANRRPDGRSLAAVALVLTAIQAVCSIFTKTDGQIGLFTTAAAFAMTANAIASCGEQNRVIRNFKFCAYTHRNTLHSVRSMKNDREGREISKVLLMDNPIVKYSCKANFPRRFVELSTAQGASDNLGIPRIIGAIVAGLILAIICGIKGGMYYALSAFTAALCVAVPVASHVSFGGVLKRNCDRLNRNGAMITSLKSAKDCSNANSVIIDAADLIDRDACEMHGMKDFKTVRLDDILLYTAAMVIKSNGPLTKVFKNVVMDENEILPSVTSINYEENLGVSGWIHGQKVLLGNRNLMLAHNIPVPPQKDEAAYLHDERKALYVAIADKLAAMFVVSYEIDPFKADYLHYLENSGVSILVDSCDPNVSAEMLEAGFNLEPGSIKVISSIAGRVFRQFKGRFYKKADAGVMHDGRPDSLLNSIATAALLVRVSRHMSIIQTILTVLCFLAMIMLAITSRFMFMNSWFIMAVEAAGILLCTITGLLRRLK